MKITNPKRFGIACGVLGAMSLGLVIGAVNVTSNIIEMTKVEETSFNNQDYISLTLENEIMEAYDLSKEAITKGLGTYIAKHSDWEESIKKESNIISWFAPSTNDMYEFYVEYR